MTSDQLLVLSLLVVPTLTAVLLWALGPNRGALVRLLSAAASLLTLALAVALTVQFHALDRAAPQPAAVSTFAPDFVPGAADDVPGKTTWDILPLTAGAVQFYLGLDGLNVWLVLLTALLLPPCVLVSFRQITERQHEYYAWLMLLNTCMFGIFLSFDIVLFYVFFEVSLVPLFFLVGIWGGVDRQYAARKFVLYTLAGSMLTLLGMLTVILSAYYCSHWEPAKRQLTFSVPELVQQVNRQLAGDATWYARGAEDRAAEWAAFSRDYWLGVQLWVFLALSAGFAVKVPLLPFHTWLPLAHTEAPTAGSVILAGVLLKIGCYGFLRLVVPLAPDVSVRVGVPLITWVAAVGIVYGAFTAFAQEDIKKLIAYSSVSHLGVVMLGLFSLDVVGLQGSLVQMINHGLSTPLLFLLIGMLYERYHTRKLADYGGMAAKLPYLAIFLVIACLSSAGLPGLNGFVGELLCLAGIFSSSTIIPEASTRWALTALGASGMVLGAWYLFTMTRRLLFGPLKEPPHDGHHVADLNSREWALLAPLVVVCVALGVYPQPVLQTAEPDVRRVAAMAAKARERVDQAKAARADGGRGE